MTAQCEKQPDVKVHYDQVSVVAATPAGQGASLIGLDATSLNQLWELPVRQVLALPRDLTPPKGLLYTEADNGDAT